MLYLIETIYKNEIRYNIFFDPSGFYLFESLTASGYYKTSENFTTYENLINSI